MTSSRHIAALLFVILTAASCRPEPEDSWGFVATLGNDTTSVERVTRNGDRIIGDAVGRSPLVVRRRWEATLAPDGSVRRWVMDTHVPNAPEGERDLHHEIERTDGAIRMVRQAGRDSMDRTVREPSMRTVPWNAFLYATSELLFQNARGLPDTARVGQYFFEGWAEGRLGFARVRPLGDGRVSITSTGLAGSGVAELDSAGRMLAYSGAGTTYHQEVRRISDVPDLDALLERFAADERSRGVQRWLSVRDTMRATVGRADIAVEYGRPLRRGRTLLGALIPYGQVWRTGANAATHLTTTAPIRLGGVSLDSGAYTLWTLPTERDVQLIINRETGQWGTGYRAENDIARVAMETDTLTTPVEAFTIRVDSAASRLVMEWGTFRWSVPVAGRR
ncbi:MAG TPA: DUF2911 domain-containing protein [Gemmatimonadales bacterium]